MTLLTIVQQHCRMNALAIPTTVAASTDSGVQQMLGILNDLVSDFVNESDFQGFTEQGLFNMTPGEDQGDINTLAPNGLLWFHNETFYDRTLRRALYGPVTDVEWQAIKAIPNPGPFYKFRIRGNRFLINPVPTTPYSQVAFEYASNWAIKTAAGIPKAQFTADDDSFRLNEQLLQKGLLYRWKRQKGLPYQADEQQYYSLLSKQITGDRPRRAYNMAEECVQDLQPGVFVPRGNWPT